MFRFSAGSPPIPFTQLKNLINASYISAIPSKQEAESNNPPKEADTHKPTQTKFISPLRPPRDRILSIFKGNFELLIRDHLELSKKNGSIQDNDLIVNNYYKNWLVLKELMERMDNRANQSKFLALGMASGWLGKYIAPSHFPLSGINWKILTPLSFTILAYLNFQFQRLAQKKEAIEAEIIQFEAKYEFVAKRPAQGEGRSRPHRLEKKIAERKAFVTLLDSSSTPKQENGLSLSPIRKSFSPQASL